MESMFVKPEKPLYYQLINAFATKCQRQLFVAFVASIVLLH